MLDKLGKKQEIVSTKIENGQLRSIFSGMVYALSSIVEHRDPYTAGHQRRVALISRAIAKEMGLDDDVVISVHIAGLLHDIGKIIIPVSILSNSGKLLDAEFNLIKQHVKIGYDILKNIDFPWPIAQAVYQHHERDDGTGYPNGFFHNTIIIEAKIIAVADVMDAMVSDRPYRQALGIEAALAEIKSGSGKRYNEDVVDACVKVFEWLQ